MSRRRRTGPGGSARCGGARTALWHSVWALLEHPATGTRKLGCHSAEYASGARGRTRHGVLSAAAAGCFQEATARPILLVPPVAGAAKPARRTGADTAPSVLGMGRRPLCPRHASETAPPQRGSERPGEIRPRELDEGFGRHWALRSAKDGTHPMRVGRHTAGAQKAAWRQPELRGQAQTRSPSLVCPHLMLSRSSFFEGFCGALPTARLTEKR